MTSLTLRDFARFVFFRSTIKRLYSCPGSKREMIKEISDKLSMTDDLYITKPNPKRFTGSFIPDSDSFIANMTQSIWKYSFTFQRMIEIHGTICEVDKRTEIEIEYRQTSELKNQNLVLVIFTSVVLLTLLLRVRDFYTAMAICFFMIIFVGTVLTSTYNKIKKQISYTEDFLIPDNE